MKAFPASLLLTATILLLAGCLGSGGVSGEDPENGSDASGNVTETAHRPASDVKHPSSLDHNETLAIDGIQGNLTARITLQPTEPAVCGWNYAAEGINEGSPLAVRAWDTAEEGSWFIAFGQPRVRVDGEVSTPPIGSGTWMLEDTGTSWIDRSVSIYLTTFGIQSLTVELGCQEPYASPIHAGTEEMVPFAGGDWDGGTSVSGPLPYDVEASDVQRSWTQESNLTVVEIVQIGEPVAEEGDLRLDTPSTTVERSFGADRMERIFLEDGPGDYRLDVSRASAGDQQIHGFVAGLEPVGDSLSDLETWLQASDL